MGAYPRAWAWYGSRSPWTTVNAPLPTSPQALTLSFFPSPGEKAGTDWRPFDLLPLFLPNSVIWFFLATLSLEESRAVHLLPPAFSQGQRRLKHKVQSVIGKSRTSLCGVVLRGKTTKTGTGPVKSRLQLSISRDTNQKQVSERLNTSSTPKKITTTTTTTMMHERTRCP